jgi:cell division protein FtsW
MEENKKATRMRELPLGRPDLIFIILVIGLTAFGLFMLLSASAPRAMQEDATGLKYVNAQLKFIILGSVCGFLIGALRLTRRLIQSRIFVWGFYGITVIGLILTPFIGTAANDTSLVRSISFGSVSIQFSEIAKFAVPLIVAWWIATYYEQFTAKRPTPREFFRFIVPPMFLGGFPILLVLIEKHKSATMILGMIFLIMLFIGNLNIRVLGLIFVAAIAAVFVYLNFIDDSTASSRLSHFNLNALTLDEKYTDFYNMSATDQREEWQTYNSLLAVGSGGATGLGYGNSRQKYFYLPEPHNDFIFAVICEELGYFRACLVILAYLLLILRGFYIAANVPDRFLSLLATGIMSHITLQVLLNLIVVTGVINTGISLPFISYGGSALVVQLCEMGIVVAISRYSGHGHLRTHV